MELTERAPTLFLALREEAKQGRDPACADETLALLLDTAVRIGAKKFLEIGAGVGLTSAAFVMFSGGRATAIEIDPERASKARNNFVRLGVSDKISLLNDDAVRALPCLTGEFDLIFLDGPKVQYRRYFSDCKRLLRSGGALVSDDVYFLGRDEDAVPKKRKMLARHLAEYRELLGSDPDFETTFYEYGEGVAVSIKR